MSTIEELEERLAHQAAVHEHELRELRGELLNATAQPPEARCAHGVAVGRVSRFVPKLVDFDKEPGEWAVVVVPVTKCGACRAFMVDQGPARPFSSWCEMTFEAQVKRAGWVLESPSVTKDGAPICVGCQAAGKASFVCALCKEERPSSEVQESFGEPAEQLCKPCYATTSAKAWNEKRVALEECHRFDFA